MVDKKSQNKKTFKNVISEIVINDIDIKDPDKYINKLKRLIDIKQYPFKFKIILTNKFYKPNEDDDDIIEVHYQHPVQVILTENNLNAFYNDLLNNLKAWIDGFQEKGSGFVCEKIISSNIKQYKYNF